MGKEGSVAPKERVNIVYRPATGDGKEEKELAFKVLMMGDYTLAEDERQLEDRKPININKDNFDSVLSAQNLSLEFNVKDTLSEGEEDGEMPVKLNVKSLKNFEPESVANQVPELRSLIELRQALLSLKGPLGNVPEFRKKIESILANSSSKETLLKDLGLSS